MQEPYGSAIAPQRGNQFDVQSDDASASSQQRVPGYVHASGQVIMVDSHDSGPDHVIRGSLDAPKPSYPSSDVQLKLKVRPPPPSESVAPSRCTLELSFIEMRNILAVGICT